MQTPQGYSPSPLSSPSWWGRATSPWNEKWCGYRKGWGSQCCSWKFTRASAYNLVCTAQLPWSWLMCTHLGLLSLLRFVQHTSSLLAQKSCVAGRWRKLRRDREHRIRGTLPEHVSNTLSRLYLEFAPVACDHQQIGAGGGDQFVLASQQEGEWPVLDISTLLRTATSARVRSWWRSEPPNYLINLICTCALSPKSSQH